MKRYSLLLLLAVSAILVVGTSVTVAAEPASLGIGTAAKASEGTTAQRVRVGVYNIAYSRGNDRDGLNDLGKPVLLLGVGALIKRQRAEIVGVTEISSMDLRGGMTHQPAILAGASGLLHHVYGENHRFALAVVSIGNGIFSKYPIRWSKNHHLYRESKDEEQRGCLEALIALPSGKNIRAFVAHLSLNGTISRRQVEQIWGIMKTRPEPCVLMGDFNSHPSSPTISFLRKYMTDVSADVAGTYWPKSFQNQGKPAEKLDYLFVKGLEAGGKPWVEGFSEGYSDHGFLLIDVLLR